MTDSDEKEFRKEQLRIQGNRNKILFVLATAAVLTLVLKLLGVLS